jgi:AcrR family transcriptional regulator
VGPAAPPERARICRAIVELVGARGYQGLSVAEITGHAGLETGAFHESFRNLQECFAAVWSAADAELADLLEATYEAEEGEWPRRLRATLDAFLTYLDQDPARARLYVAEVQQVSDEMRALREAAQARLATYVDRGRDGVPDRAPEHVAEAVAGAIWFRLENRLRKDEAGRLRSELPLMAYFAVLPYCGAEIAEAELRRPPEI